MTTLALAPACAVPSRPLLAPAARPLALAGFAILALAPLSLAGLWLDPRVIDAGHGALESVWLTPLKFQLSVSLHLLTIALGLAALAGPRRIGRLARGLIATLLACAVFEIIWITGRGAFGLRSHFAADLLGQVGFVLMGLGAVGLVAATAVLGLLILRGRPAGMAPHLHLAIGLGFALSGIAGLISGATIGEMDGPLVGATGGAGLPLVGWSTTGGDLRVAHFVGLHAAQALPLLALAVGARGPGQGRVAVWAGAALLATLAMLVYLQALAGQPLIAL
jgi:hypothetical protein